MESLLHVYEKDIITNARLKVYKEFKVLQVSNVQMFKDGGWEAEKPRFKLMSSDPDKERSLESSRARAKRAIYDVGMCNRFEYFFTWTLNKDYVDRFNVDEVYKKVRTFLSNAVQRKAFEYVLIPEKHKDGAIHMHGLCNLGTVRIERAKSPYTGHELFDGSGRDIFNMLDWWLGHSTCVKLDENYEKAVGYITKYITKSEEKIFGKWYLSSRNLQKKPEYLMIDYIPYDDFVNPEKVGQGIQSVVNVYKDVKICNEVIRECVSND